MMDACGDSSATGILLASVTIQLNLFQMRRDQMSKSLDERSNEDLMKYACKRESAIRITLWALSNLCADRAMHLERQEWAQVVHLTY